MFQAHGNGEKAARKLLEVRIVSGLQDSRFHTCMHGVALQVSQRRHGTRQVRASAATAAGRAALIQGQAQRTCEVVPLGQALDAVALQAQRPQPRQQLDAGVHLQQGQRSGVLSDVQRNEVERSTGIQVCWAVPYWC